MISKEEKANNSSQYMMLFLLNNLRFIICMKIAIDMRDNRTCWQFHTHFLGKVIVIL